jgi:hypothetical protein
MHCFVQTLLTLCAAYLVSDALHFSKDLTTYVTIGSVVGVIFTDVLLTLIVVQCFSKITNDHFYLELVWHVGAMLCTVALSGVQQTWYGLTGWYAVCLLVLGWALYKLWTTELAMIGSAPYPPTKGRVTLIILLSSGIYAWMTIKTFESILPYSIYAYAPICLLWFAVGIFIARGRHERKKKLTMKEPPVVEANY